jgi:hypothetical protein
MLKRIFIPVLVSLVLLELSFRAYFAIKFDDFNVFLQPKAILYQFYPSLKQVEVNSKSESEFKILLLGGSVIHPLWSDFEKLLLQSLQENSELSIQVDNLAQSSHTSLDSKIKYQLLEDKGYDAILIYHGINELRFNLCSDEDFKEDYSHVSFYRKVHSLTNWGSAVSILPYTYSCFTEIIQENLFPNKNITLGSPLIDSLDQNLIRHGTNVKTVKPFYQNYNYIIEQALANGSAVITPTFATYIPPDYSLKKFNAKELGYVKHTLPIELWGSLESVEKGIMVHRKAMEELTTKQTHQNLYVIELDKTLNLSDYFNDVCHLSKAGTIKFLSEVNEVFFPLLERKRNQE